MGVYSLLNLINCMPKSLDNQIHGTWPSTLESHGIAEVEEWCSQQCFPRVSARGSWLQGECSKLPRSASTIYLSHICVCPFSPHAEDSNSTAIPMAVLAHLWLQETWPKGRLKECVRKHCDSSAFKLYFLWILQELLPPGGWYCFDLCIQAVGLYDCSFLPAQYKYFWENQQCCISWGDSHCTILNLTQAKESIFQVS